MVLGGVVIGSMKVQEVVMVVLIIRIYGCILMVSVKEVNMGNSMVVVVRLEVILVKKLIIVMSMKSSNNKGMLFSNINCVLIYFVRLVVLKFWVIVKLLLNNRRMFQGSFIVFFQVNIDCLLLGVVGKINRSILVLMVIIVLLIFGIKCFRKKECVIQVSVVFIKISSMVFFLQLIGLRLFNCCWIFVFLFGKDCC